MDCDKDETIRSIEARLSVQENIVTRLVHLIDGNGQPGLADKIDNKINTMRRENAKSNKELSDRMSKLVVVLAASGAFGPSAITFLKTLLG